MATNSDSNTIKFVTNEKKSQSQTSSNGTVSDCTSSNPIFAPWSVPFKRRQQTFAHLVVLALPYFLQSLNFIFIIIPLFWPIYLAYIFFISRDTAPENGSRPIYCWRNLFLWRWYSDYFPSTLINEADLDPDRNYIFGYHPHGIIGLGVMSNFGFNADRIEKIFPNINIRPVTLDVNFKIPFYREHILSLGFASASKKSIKNILGKGPGNACLIVVGGAEEALEAKPDRVNLKLANRCGFVKMALECGADLVPVFGFGENQLYDQVSNEPGTWLYKLQHQFKKAFSFTMPLFYGRGAFNYVFGILPHRLPLTVVTGTPIKVEKNANPTDEQIHDLHQRYLDALTDLYDRNKAAYWVGSNPPEINFY